MSLSCGYCDYEDEDVGFRTYCAPGDYSVYDRRNTRLCQSCGETRIRPGDVVNKFTVEITTYFSEQDEEWKHREAAPVYQCEACADLYWSLQGLGFECVHGGENMKQLAREYAELNRPADRKWKLA